MAYLVRMAVTVVAVLPVAVCWEPADGGEIHDAARTGDVRKLEALLGADRTLVNEEDKEGSTPLHLAAEEGRNASVKLLLERGGDVDAIDSDGRTPLHRAARWDHVRVAELLLDRKAGVGAKDKRGWTPLHAAAAGDMKMGTRGGASPGVTKLLLDKGADKEAKDGKGFRPLHVAVQYGKTEAVKILVARKADIGSKASYGRTPLHLAAESGRRGAAEALVAAGADIEAKDDLGWSPLARAASSGMGKVVEFLLSRGADVHTKGKDGRTPLHLAARNARFSTIGVLIESGADVFARDAAGRTPRDCARASPLREGRTAAKILLEAEKRARLARAEAIPRDEINRPDAEGRTALQNAARRGSGAEVAALIERGASVHARDPMGYQALHFAARSGRPEAVKALLEGSADPNAETKDGKMPLALAAGRGGTDGEAICVLLLKRGAHPGAAPNLLRLAAGRGHADLVEGLLAKGVPPDENTLTECLRSAGIGVELPAAEKLEQAAHRGKPALLRLLLAAHTGLTHAPGKEILAWAVRNRKLDVARALIRGGVKNAEAGKQAGPLLAEAVKRLDHEMIRLVLALGADPNRADKTGPLPLTQAVGVHWSALRDLKELNRYSLAERAAAERKRRDSVEAVKLLLEAGAHPEGGGQHDNLPPRLHSACLAGSAEIVELLLKHGADIKAKDFHGKTVLMIACGSYMPSPEVVKLLLASGCDPNEKNRGWTALDAAVCRGNAEAAAVLLDAGARPVGRLASLEAALRHAAESGDLDVTRLLLERGARIDARFKEGGVEVVNIGGGGVPARRPAAGVTALYRAMKKGCLDVARLLIQKGADVTVESRDGETLLHFAAECGDRTMVRLLIDRGLDVNARTREPDWPNLGATWSETPLHRAARMGRHEIAGLLLERGAEASPKDSKGETPMHHALRRNDKRTVVVLRRHGADDRVLDADAVKVVRAASRGKLDQLKGLIAGNAKLVGATDQYGKTPLHHAAEGGDVAMASFLLEQAAEVDARDKKRHTPLILACRSACVDVTKLLIEHGADVNTIAEPKGLAPVTPLLSVLRGHHYPGTPASQLALVRLLVEHGADVNLAVGSDGIPLHAAAGGGNTEVLKLLLDNGADANSRTRLYAAIHRAHTAKMLELLLEHGADPNVRDCQGKTKLHGAVWLSDGGKSVALLIRRGATVNVLDKKGNSPLHFAAKAGRADAAKRLIEAGADANVTRDDGWTPLHLAEYGKRKEVARLLIEGGARPTGVSPGAFSLLRAVEKNHPATVAKLLAQDPGLADYWDTMPYPPLHTAIHWERGEVAKALLDGGAKVEVRDKKGRTPLFVAVGRWSARMVKLLVKYHADPALPGPDGLTPLELAEEKGAHTIAELLRRAADLRPADRAQPAGDPGTQEVF